MTIMEAHDETSEEIVRASRIVAPIDGFPQTVIATYSRVKFESLLERYPGERITTLNTAYAPVDIYRTEYDGEAFATYLSQIGGPIAAALMEEVIALGGRRFLFFGSCGVLDNDILSNHIAVPTAAYRDEGTSYHYLPPAPYIGITTAGQLAGILRDLDVPFHLTKTWTTDAIYRETRRNMERRKAEECRVVETECASTAAVAQFRGVGFYQFLYGADSLGGEEWDPRSLAEVADEENAAVVDLGFRIARRLAH